MYNMNTKISATTLGWRRGLRANAMPCGTTSTASSGSAKSRGFSPCHRPSDAIFTAMLELYC